MEFYLDPAVVATLEPSAGDEQRREWISVFAVPSAITSGGPLSGPVSRLLFEYPGGETGDAVEPLDGRDDPTVTVRTARYTGKILELSLGSPANADVLRRLAGRLAGRSEAILTKSKKFSYLMISRILDKFADTLTS